MPGIKLWDAVGVVGLDQKALKKGLASAKKGFTLGIGGLVKIAKKGAKILAVTVAGIAAGLTGIAAISLKKFAEFEKGIAEIQTLFGQSEAKSQELREDLEATVGSLVRGFGQSVPDAIKATYDAVSAGIKRADVAAFTERAAKLAIAGATDISTAVDLLTSAVNAYGLEASDVETISDQLFTTVRLGKTTIEELSGALGRVAPIASAAGIATEEMFSAIAVLTAQGISTRESVTGLKATIQSLLRPTEQAAELAESLGLEWNAGALQAKGLAGVLDDLVKATGGNIEDTALLAGGVEALNAVLALTSQQGAEAFQEALGEMELSAGATEVAFETMADTTTFQWNRMRGGIDLVLIRIGESLNRAFGPMLRDLNDWVDENKEGFDEVAAALDTMVDKIRRSATDGRLKQMIDSLKAIAEQVFELARVFNDPQGDMDKAISNFLEIFSDRSGDFIRIGGDLAAGFLKGFATVLAVGAGALINEFIVEPLDRALSGIPHGGVELAFQDVGRSQLESQAGRSVSTQNIDTANFTFPMPQTATPEIVEEGVGRALLKIQRQAGQLSQGFVEAGA